MRLREQQVTVKPRIVITDTARFKVEYYGKFVQDHCGTSFPTFDMAVRHANNVAARYPHDVQRINAERTAGQQQ